VKRIIVLAISVILALAVAAPLAFGQGTPTVTDLPKVMTVMTGLDQPRGLTFGPDGALYIAEAGRGGAQVIFENGNTSFRLGATGAISRVLLDSDGLASDDSQKQIVTGLPSITGPVVTSPDKPTVVNNTAQAGPTDISFLGTGPPESRGAYVTLGLRMDSATRDGPLIEGLSNLGRLVYFPGLNSDKWQDKGQYIADLAGGAPPDYPTPPDSNPYSVLAEPKDRVVADAGANTLLRVDSAGAISLLATFPEMQLPAEEPTDAVPTSVVVGPDGAYYVGQLTGFPIVQKDGTANVYRVERDASPTPEPVALGENDVYLDGFKAIIDIAFDTEGSLYVLQYVSGDGFSNGTGKLIRVDNPGDSIKETRTTIMEGLRNPTSIAVGPVDDDTPDEKPALYVTNRTGSPGNGEVLRIEQ
jgi:hypothetical protein